MTTPPERVVAAFRRRFGAEPDGVWSAPGRVNLLGEHTDYNDGLVLPVAIDRRTQVAVRRRSDGLARCVSMQQAQPVTCRLAEVGPAGGPQRGPAGALGWAAYPLGVAWALRAAGLTVPGFEVMVDSDLPAGAGLASSAALAAGVALALAELAGASGDRTGLALAGRRAEAEVVGVPVGAMDHMVAMHARAGHALGLDCRELSYRHVPLDLAGAGQALMVLDTRVVHRNATSGYADRRRECERAARLLGARSLREVTAVRLADGARLLGPTLHRRARHVLTDNARVAEAVAVLGRGGPAALGPLMAASQRSIRDDFEISCPELDLAVGAATRAGALAARLTGGGFGGCAVALVPAECGPAVVAGVRHAFAAAGFRPPEIFSVRSTEGARRIR